MNTLLITAIKSAIYAGAEIMKIYSGSFEVTLKQDNSPLTIADEHANTMINSYLEKTEIPIISEENKQVVYTIRKDWDTCWIVDPLDGTKEFIKRNGEFTVNIALIKNNKPILGVIYVPVSKTLYYANVSENKAYKYELNSHEYTESIFQNSVELTPKKNDDNQIKIVGSRSHKSEETEGFINILKSKGKDIDLVSKGSSLKFCLVAEGKANIYPRFAPTMEWDTAAGHAICSAVGLKVMQINENNELQYNKQDLLNPYFIVQ
ncbi:3'(2'),5'-bisphosphate nucleotidase CysQ [Mariniflexile litorale]|uniref:3'(2'),5'-bisphosphate nucleotidase CysQ n=1 Tax=Mariniflexile litorale TaxID=3045158 RepID=A0AAU7EC56_9FLAO|nr:3'(2'),5'-bisphosphate nucleotidase CysQ [Mariniflexile sp. KMM 9835]MDQ8212233.1 3'(2'),5'-bisphosphate nucleotidase CysQ [Mariniflexile sp. KMM 9835]